MKKIRKTSLLLQVAILFAIGVVAVGLLTYGTLHRRAEESVKNQIESRFEEMSEETIQAVKEYPAYEWLIKYWYHHADELDIEYDAVYEEGTVTEQKSRTLGERYPGIQLKYVTTQELEAMPEEDQKLYAEVAYSWVITRIDQIKQIYHIDFLFCVMTDQDFREQFFLLSGADQGSVRGTEYEEVYPLGVTVTVEESQQKAMQEAIRDNSYLADAGDYMDYYAYFGQIDGSPVLIGITYNLTDLRASIQDQTWQVTVFAVLFQIILSVICLLVILCLVLLPLKKVQKNIRLYQETKESETIIRNLSGIQSGNELGQLADDVKSLSLEIDDYLKRIQSITAEKERISVELSLATKIQSAFIPHTFPAFPERSEFNIHASMNPAKEVGGDFYDFFLIDDDHLCMVIADVSGKGVPAALFMMVSKLILQNCAMLGRSAGEIMTITNEAICDNNDEEMFVTVWLGILEISTGRLTAANAGHEYPAIKKRDGRFELLRDRHGIVIGGIEGTQYDEYEIMLEPHDKVFIYTDGVPEAKDADDNMFGMKRMLQALNAEPDAEPDRLLENVSDAVREFVQDAEQFDDLTMLCLEYEGNCR